MPVRHHHAERTKDGRRANHRADVARIAYPVEDDHHGALGRRAPIADFFHRYGRQGPDRECDALVNRARWQQFLQRPPVDDLGLAAECRQTFGAVFGRNQTVTHARRVGERRRDRVDAVEPRRATRASLLRARRPVCSVSLAFGHLSFYIIASSSRERQAFSCGIEPSGHGTR